MNIVKTPTHAALVALVILQAIMLTALYAKIPPHPPEATPLFGMAPFLAAAISAAVCSILMGDEATRAGRALAGLAAVMALVSFGPQKYMDAQFPLIWPAVIAAQLSVIAIGYRALRGRVGAAVLA